MKLGILLTCSPLHEGSRTVAALASAAAQRGHTVEIFLMEEGLYNLLDTKFLELRSRNFAGKISISVCSVNAEQLGIPRVEGVRFASQYDHALLANNSDHFLHFGP